MNHMDDLFPTNGEIARILFQIASILDMIEGNEYRVRAYRRAALGVLLMRRSLAECIVNGDELPLPGVGDRIKGRLYDLVNTGHMGVHEALLEELGAPLTALLAVEGIGPKTAVTLIRELQIESLAELAEAARTGRIRELRGFGPKREEKIGRHAEELLASAA
jgi:DNA polymerase (family 10)